MRNRKFVITIRIITGLLFLASGISGFMMGPAAEGTPADMLVIGQSLWDSGIFQLVKIVEIVAGAMLVLGVLPALAVTFLVPICVGVLVFTLCTMPAYILMGLIATVLVAILINAYWGKYRALFTRGS